MPAAVRYIVDDVDAAIPFYVDALGVQTGDASGRPAPPPIQRMDIVYLFEQAGSGWRRPVDDRWIDAVPGGRNRIHTRIHGS